MVVCEMVLVFVRHVNVKFLRIKLLGEQTVAL